MFQYTSILQANVIKYEGLPQPWCPHSPGKPGCLLDRVSREDNSESSSVGEFLICPLISCEDRATAGKQGHFGSVLRVGKSTRGSRILNHECWLVGVESVSLAWGDECFRVGQNRKPGTCQGSLRCAEAQAPLPLPWVNATHAEHALWRRLCASKMSQPPCLILDQLSEVL